jgi:hypothetical protein
MKRILATLVIVSFLSPSLALAVDGNKASYFGGTVTLYAGSKDPVEGQLDLTGTNDLVLRPEKRPYAGIFLIIPYKQIEDLEYGQKAGRRVGAAVGAAVLLGPIGLLALLSKKRKHYVTIAYKDETGTEQVAILELGKDIVRETLPILKARSGKAITYQDDEARKSVGQ